ncbi:uncharacterized protein K452DRAFT_293600 [Aplosporella prunicola CBS 121167]|uniref:F-box domain-containing protein n=1 Tax=Aplosporella prunicola CBS 121167 TaxID=1176127 RepID=A0A6A6BW57_9PEZI|nr:uncharacterized protein K452DRAFT_293600 [Aplosporella prunicola CBS 121167]KAF2147127.1 hypothetical protein K452DRAFT_293600 [Aplosporella prunicola CBS 121167]
MAPSRKINAKPKSKSKSAQIKTSSSSDVGEGTETRYNPLTGRPIRDGAGRKSLDVDYLDTIEALEEDSGDEVSEDEEGQLRTRKKRKRTPSPPLPPLPPLPQNPEDIRSREPTPDLHMSGMTNFTSLTFNVPPGFKGPFVVNLDDAALSKLQSQTPRPVKRQRTRRNGAPSHHNEDTINVAPREFEESGKPRPGEIGFVDLPPEIRNKIYRLLFVDKDAVDFERPFNFCRSSALLRANRQVYNEGRSVLYSENKFMFARNHNRRGNYWDAEQTEIGFKDFRVFLKSIGPTNISLLRDIEVIFTDAAPSATPRITNEERRFVHDEHLIDCLRMLGENGRLKEARFSFAGRKIVGRTDYRFIDALRSIEVDKVDMEHRNRYQYGYKIESDVKNELKKCMVRSKKLYSHD